MRIKLVSCWVVLIWAAVAVAGDKPLPSRPAKKSKCPVCGMFVAKYPDWIAQMHFSDKPPLFFDGAKDLFKYYLNLNGSQAEKSHPAVTAIYVSDYYSLKPLDAEKAFYVIGSDVYGPMGRELIPLETQISAEEFLRDHHGRHILRFGDVSPELIRKLE